MQWGMDAQERRMSTDRAFGHSKTLKVIYHRDTEGTEKSFLLLTAAIGAVNKVKLCALCALCVSVVKVLGVLQIAPSS